MLAQGAGIWRSIRNAIAAMRLFAEFVAEALLKPAARGTCRYLVVDTAATRPTNMVAELALTGSGFDILTGDRCVWREAASPVLIELPAAASENSLYHRTGEALAKWQFANCFVYLESLHSREATVRLLRERTEAVLPQGVPVLLRHFDSRVLTALVRTLSGEQLSTFLSAATRWAWPGRRGELTVLKQEIGLTRAAFVAPLEFDSTQEAALIDVGEADAMVDLLLDQNNGALQALLPPEQHERISAMLDVATTLGIDQLTDQAAYCSLALELGPAFCEDEPWAASMPDVRAGRLRFADVLERVAQGEEV
jgi:Domain of unknown function (DUF4123)